MENKEIKKLQLERPLIFFDLETTGTNPLTDRIVEISILKVFPDGHTEEKCRRINPGCKIPAEATKVHHITDEDVANECSFSQIAKSLLELMDGCDIAGFNSNRFDVPMLVEEFSRAQLKFSLSDRRFIDVQNIYHKKEPRTLVAAYRYYCEKDLEDAHSAAADTRATYEVLLSQLSKYDDLENNVDFLANYSGDNKKVDIAGYLRLNDNDEPIINFGKSKGKTIKELMRYDQRFLSWMLSGNFPKDTKDRLMAIMASIKAENNQKK